MACYGTDFLFPFCLPDSIVPRKTPWKLSATRKANARSRLKKVDDVIEAVRASGVRCHALVRFLFIYFKVGLSLTYVRTVHWNYRKSMRCRPRTSTQSSVRMQKDTEKASTRYQNGQEYAIHLDFGTQGLISFFFDQLTLRTNPKGF